MAVLSVLRWHSSLPWGQAGRAAAGAVATLLQGGEVLLPQWQQQQQVCSGGSGSNISTLLLARRLHAAAAQGVQHGAPSQQQAALATAAPTVEETHSTSEDGAAGDDKVLGPMALYKQRREKGLYRPDARQELTSSMLQDLWESLHVASSGFRPPTRRRVGSGLTMVDSISHTSHIASSGASHRGHAHKHTGKAHSSSSSSSMTGSKHGSKASSGGGGFWAGVSSLLGGGGDAATSLHHQQQHEAQQVHTQGLYMYGGVGVGKTMLMDVFVETATHDMKVLRTHFHDFMLGVHEKLRKYKGDADPLLRVADSIAKTVHVLALDEFFVTDVADAMILSRLFGRLWDRNVVLVATSNRHPDKLYEGGLQRALFLPFIARLKSECLVHDMASTTDYRRLAHHQRGLYFVQARAGNQQASADEELKEEWLDCTEGASVQPETLDVKMGRTIHVKQAAGPCALMTFHELCGLPVAAADYIALAERFHTLAVTGVPVFTGANRSEGYRFVTLVDILYEHRTRLLLSAEGSPFDLFENVVTQADLAADPSLKAKPNLLVDDNLGFAKDRTISRLLEMQTLEHLVAHARQHAPSNLLALLEAQAKAAKAAKQH